MSARIDVIERVAQNTIGVDDERGTDNAQLLGAILFPHLADAVLATHFSFVVRQEPYREPVLVAKLCVAQAIVATDPQDHAIMPRELLFMIAEIDGLKRAKWRVVAGIEKQYGMPPTAQ